MLKISGSPDTKNEIIQSENMWNVDLEKTKNKTIKAPEGMDQRKITGTREILRVKTINKHT